MPCFLFLSLSLLLQVSALKAPPLAQLRPLCDQGVANKTLIRASAVVSGPKRQSEESRVELVCSVGALVWWSAVVVTWSEHRRGQCSRPGDCSCVSFAPSVVGRVF